MFKGGIDKMLTTGTQNHNKVNKRLDVLKLIITLTTCNLSFILDPMKTFVSALQHCQNCQNENSFVFFHSCRQGKTKIADQNITAF